MVRYTGGMKRITGAVNTIQRGLKMSGCPSRVGRSPTNSRSISHRVNCNIALKPCGAHGYSGCLYSVNPAKVSAAVAKQYCWKPMGGSLQKKRQLRTAALAGGVGRINGPRFHCKCGNGSLTDLIHCN